MRSFKKILKTAGLFVLVVSLISALFITCYLKGENYHYQDGRERDELAGSLTFLLCGTSHTLFGILPDVISANCGVNCYSLSGTMMTLRGRCVLLEQELARNPQVRTVVLELSPSTLISDRDEDGPNGDLQVLGRLNDPGLRWEFFKSAFPVREWPAVYYDLVSKGIESVVRLLNGSYTAKNQIIKSGYYKNGHEDRDIPNNYADLCNTQSLPETVVPENAEWLEKVVELCRQDGRQVFLITPPQTKCYNCIYDNLDFFQEWFTAFAEEKGVPYYNFNLAKNKLDLLPDDTCYYDETHLNAAGGEIFTGMLTNILNRHEQGRDNSSCFYNSYEELDQMSHYFD